MTKCIRIIFFVTLFVILLISGSSAVWAYLYRASLQIVESTGVAYTMLPVSVPSNNAYMATNGFMLSTALDTRVETLGGTIKPHMVTDTKIWTAVPVPANSQTNLYFTTGNTPPATTPMSIITGYGGYISVADDTGAGSMELGNNFVSEFLGYVDTTAGATKNLISKPYVFRTYVSAAVDGTITSEILTPTFTWTTPTGGGGGAWAPAASAYDDNTATWAAESVPLSSWSSFYAATIGAMNSDCLRFYADTDANITEIDCDVFYTAAWHHVYQGAYADETYITKYYPLSSVTSIRFAFRNVDAGGAHDAQLRECDFGEVTGSAVAATASILAVPSGAYTITTTATGGGTNFLTLTANPGGFTSGNIALAGATVTDTFSGWTIDQSNVMPYFTSYSHTVSAVLVAHYHVATIIVNATGLLPDLVAPAQDGTITWGSSPGPAGIATVLGGMTPPASTYAGATGDVTSDIVPDVPVSNWNAEPAVTGALLTNPLRPLVLMVSDNTPLTERQTWRFYGVIFVLFITVTTARAVRRHLGIASIACGASIGVCAATSVFPLATFVLTVILVIGGMIMERTQSIG